MGYSRNFPEVCVSVLAGSPEEARVMVTEASRRAEMVELRMDALGGEIPDLS